MLDNKVVVFGSISLKLIAIGSTNSFTINLRELAGNFRRFACNRVDEGETASQEDTNYSECNQRSEEIIQLCEVPIFPNDISWLRRWLKLKRLSKKLFVCLSFQS